MKHKPASSSSKLSREARSDDLAEHAASRLSPGPISLLQPKNATLLSPKIPAKSAGIESQQQHAKHPDVFREQSFDYIVTVCDRMREVCPSFPDDPELIHWSIADPAGVEGSEEERRRAFEHVTLQLTARIRALLSLLAQPPSQSISELATLE